jgi:hypothetical protein
MKTKRQIILFFMPLAMLVASCTFTSCQPDEPRVSGLNCPESVKQEVMDYVHKFI